MAPDGKTYVLELNEAGDKISVSRDTINAVSAAASIAAGIGIGAAGIAVSGAGAVSQNVILTKTDAFALESVPGPAGPGDFVALTVRGVTLARVDGASTIEAGQRLTVAESDGTVRPLRTRSLDGMEVTEGTPVVGVAVGAADEDSGLVPVYVMLP